MLNVLRRLLLLAVLATLIGVLAVACEDEEEEGTATPAATETPAATATATPSPEPLGPGAAGIPSNPREVVGLESVITLDDGLAIWDERPANEDRTGVTDDTIKLGRTAGVTGFLAAYEVGWGPMMDALIERVNEAGGVHGRKIEVTTRDDRSDPTVGVQVTTELVERDSVFAMFFAIGAPTHNAVQAYLSEKRVPNLFYLDGSDVGQEPVTSKWDFAGQNSDILSGRGLGDAVYELQPDATVAVVYADFPASQAGLEGIRYAAEQAGQPILGEFSHDLTQVDLTAQAQQVDATGADWVIYHGSITQALSLIKALRETVGSDIPVAQWGALPTGDPATDALIDGTVTVRPTGDDEFLHPEKAAWAELKALADEEGITYSPVVTPIVVNNVEHLIRALEMAGPDLTREGLVEALEIGFDGSWTCNACLGPTVLGPQDHWTNETYITVRWNDAEKLWDNLGEISYETSEGKGVRGNIPGYECQPETCPWEE